MIDAYFAELNQTIQSFSNVQTSTLQKKHYSANQGYFSGSLLFTNGYRLEFVEMKDMYRLPKLKYRYQYMDPQNATVFRYDNSPHHNDVATFPHHKHVGKRVEECSEPTLFDVLMEIAQRERVTNSDDERLQD